MLMAEDSIRLMGDALDALLSAMTAATSSLSDLVIERVGFGLFVLDRAMNVLMWNRFMQDHNGIPAADVIGRNLFDCFPDLPRAWLSRKLESVFQLGSFAFSSWEQRPCSASSTTGRSRVASTTCSRTARSCRSRAAATSKPCA